MPNMGLIQRLEVYKLKIRETLPTISDYQICLIRHLIRYLGYFRVTCYSILGMEEKVTRLIVSTSCPFCSGDRLYRLRDNRFTGTRRSCNYSPKRFKDDFALLHYVSLEIPANKAARGLGFGSTTVRRQIDALSTGDL